MPRIAGVDIPPDKPIRISLRYIYGVGPTNSDAILKELGIDGQRRAKDVTEEELAKIIGILDRSFLVEGALRRSIQQNIARLRDIGSWRPGEGLAQGIQQRSLIGRPRMTLAIHDQATRVEAILETVAEADKRITRQALAAFDAFQQEARPERLQLQVRRNRRIEVGGDIEQGRRHSRLLWREGPGGRTTKNPSHGGSRRWVLNACERN